MSHFYIECSFEVSPRVPGAEILLAQLSEFPFESFEETDEGLNAYIRKEDWHNELIKEVGILQDPSFQITQQIREIAPENWNKKWETHFEPIEIGSECRVRAPFHEKKEVVYDIVIEPKMSFGTGHHETTHMMLQFVLELELTGKKVLDMGCGTAVLAILAAMKGATHVDGIDIDSWSYLNAKENVLRNEEGGINIYQGDVDAIPDVKYDIILANINRNILLADVGRYAEHLDTRGKLLLSGFYIEDEPIITAACENALLSLKKKTQKNNWMAAIYSKI
ncbi:50S ribosomal protein L11 methyltransferase [Muriicola sp.]|uniref:50S ribosomal protein L11 methyltransferase n=1 Tax=Muriicola sp. TaxID=2020856 RepID=UPI003C788057